MNTKAKGRYHIETWGCQMNVHDSEKLAGALELDGYVRASDPGAADVVLLNTCSIREKAAEKVFSELGRIKPLKDANPAVLIGVCGCVGQQEGTRIFDRAPYVDFVIGPRATGSLTATVERLRNGQPSARHSVDTEYRNDSIHFPYEAIRHQSLAAAKAYVTIIEGCNHRCTYCIVPTTRGREIYRHMDEVLAEVHSLAERGVIEVEFLGQTVNAYRDAQGRTLADLLLATAEIERVERIRFTTSHPAQMTDRLMDAMAAAQPKVCSYLHLPVQSGSSAVLRSMRRGYDREGYLGKIEGLRARIPHMLFGTDIIVGFPTESETDFEETMTLLDLVEYDTVYSFTYSPRPGTAALAHGDALSQTVKVDRLRRLQGRQQEIQERRHREWIGRSVRVLVEGRSKRDAQKWTGRTVDNRIVHFSAADTAPGRLETVEIDDSTAYSLRGRPLASRA